MTSDAAGSPRSTSNRTRGDAAVMPTSSPFAADGGGAGSPTRVERMLREREHSRRHLLASDANAMDTDAASLFAGSFAADGVQSPGRASPANMEDAGSAATGHAARPPLAGSRSGFRRLGLRGMKQRLLVVANRLPVSANRRGEDQWSLEISAGGLVSALLGVKDVDAKWIGWAGVNVPDEVGQRALTRALAEKVCCNFNIISMFHTYDYARHFVSACTRILGLEGTPEGVEDQGRLTRVAAFPIGIDSDRFKRALELPAVKRHISELTQRFAGRKVMLGVDRLDMIKGIPQKILAFEKFLEENPDWNDKVVLLQIAVPTRTDVPEYVALVTSLRDGMNLFAGAAQSLGAGAILVNPWNITEVADSIRHALTMSSDEREKRHRHNYAHVTTHTAQDWAETFVCELNDTVAEAQLRTRQVPPSLPSQTAIQQYLRSKNRLLILGFNSTLTEPVESSGRRGGDQIKEMELKLHPDLKGSLKALCEDEHTTVIVLSGSDRSVLDEDQHISPYVQNFGEFKMWLAAEHGMFLRPTNGEWMTTMPEHLNMDWVDSVKHLWTGPISNAAVDVVQGSRSVEVRSVGVTKGAAIDRILGEIVHSENMVTPIDYVLCVGHFLGKDEDIYVFFDPEYPSESKVKPEGGSTSLDRRPNGRPSNGRSNSRSSQSRTQKPQQAVAERSSASSHSSASSDHNWREGSSVLDLKGENYFSCAVGRKRSNARYLLNSSEEVVSFLKEMATATADFQSGSADYMFLDRQ
ncbi:hypothetical protein HU200_026726 [Digitaria exilis]|uniref:Alpha,alpha-trehalose-phosphate synthase (UDP-forming) n=1 Tax=Digitaria exilis TaxID=1010633 RepID=A0A835EWV5_9POAL|nr:hypothetical protein HU200_026726 [Digitaria exilis]